MKANTILSTVLSLFIFLPCVNTLQASHLSSEDQAKTHIYVSRRSLILLPEQKLAVWHGRKLMSVAAVHTDHRGSYVYVDEMKDSLATAHPYRVFSKAPGNCTKKQSKRQILREKWTYICQICGWEFTSRDALYDHIWEKHNAR